MWRGSLQSMLLIGVLLVLCGLMPRGAAAQSPARWTAPVVTDPPGLPELISEFRRPAFEPAIHAVDVPDTVVVGEEAIFSARTNVDSAPMPLRCRWDYGDGTTARGLYARHRYDEPGTYDVTFRLSGRDEEAAASTSVTVVPAGEGDAPSPAGGVR